MAACRLSVQRMLTGAGTVPDELYADQQWRDVMKDGVVVRAAPDVDGKQHREASEIPRNGHPPDPNGQQACAEQCPAIGRLGQERQYDIHAVERVYQIPTSVE